MVPALQGTYDGGCKNGMAQGKGTARGTDTYMGFFKNGLPNGKGFTPGHRAINTMGNGIWVCGKEKGLLQEPLVERLCNDRDLGKR